MASGTDLESQRGLASNGGYMPLLGEQNGSVGAREYIGMFDRPLPCCGCGIGWFSFLIGFFLPLFWYYGTYLFFAEHYRHDPRERPGLAACAIAALVNTVGTIIAVIVLLAEHKLVAGIFA